MDYTTSFDSNTRSATHDIGGTIRWGNREVRMGYAYAPNDFVRVHYGCIAGLDENYETLNEWEDGFSVWGREPLWDITEKPGESAVFIEPVNEAMTWDGQDTYSGPSRDAAMECHFENTDHEQLILDCERRMEEIVQAIGSSDLPDGNTEVYKS